jgi:hyperosmotically inducible protein
MKTMLATRIALAAAVFVGPLLILSQAYGAAIQQQASITTAAVDSLILPQAYGAAMQDATPQAEPQDPVTAHAAAKLGNKQFHDVKVAVDNGIATLSGTVSLYEYKADAEKHVRHVKGVTAVRNLIQVAGPDVPDHDLQAKLVEKLSYDRVGYGNVFNSIGVSVENGVATLGGHARTDVDKDSALALVATTPGVKDLVDTIEVDPVSIMDDQTRMAVARAVYGFSTLNKYAIDPAKPIRISVQNGNVELYGIVDSKSDSDAAYLRANGVSGVFSVKNYLQVANQPTESH